MDRVERVRFYGTAWLRSRLDLFFNTGRVERGNEGKGGVVDGWMVGRIGW